MQVFAAVELMRTAAKRAVFDAASSGGVVGLTLSRRLPNIGLLIKPPELVLTVVPSFAISFLLFVIYRTSALRRETLIMKHFAAVIFCLRHNVANNRIAADREAGCCNSG